MANAGQIRAGGAVVEIGGDDRDLKRALDSAAARLRALGNVATAVGREFLKLGAGIVTPLALAGKAFANMGDDIAKASTRTGVQVEQLSALAYAAKQSGSDLEGLEGGLRKMQKTVAGAAGGSKEAADALAEIGLSVQDLAGLSPDQMFSKIATGIDGIHDPTAKAAEAMKIFGKNGTSMLPLLQGGAAGIKELTDAASRLGLVMSTEDARGAEEFGDRMDDLTQVLKNGVFRVGAAVAPVLRGIAVSLTEGAVKTGQWISAHRPMIQTALCIGAGLVAAGAGFLVLGKTVGLVASALNGIGKAFVLARSAVGLFGPALTILTNPIGLIVAGLAGVALYLAYTTETGRDMLAALGSYFMDLKSTVLEAIGGITDALGAGDWKLAADIAWTGVKLAFVQGIAPLKSMWVDLKAFAEETWTLIGAAMVSATLKAVAAVKSAWIEAKSWVNAQGSGLGFQMSRHEEDSRHDYAVDVINHGRDDGHLTKEQADAQLAAEERYHQKQLNAVDNAAQKNAGQIDAARDQQLAANEADLQAKLRNIDQTKAADLKRIDETSKAEVDANAAQLNDLEKQLREKRAKAKTESDAHAAGLLPTLGRRPNMPDADDIAAMMQQTKSAGTFSAAGAFGLGSSQFAQRQAVAAERAAKLLESVDKTMAAVAQSITGGLLTLD